MANPADKIRAMIWENIEWRIFLPPKDYRIGVFCQAALARDLCSPDASDSAASSLFKADTDVCVRFPAPAALFALSFLDLLLPCGQRAWLYCSAAVSPGNMGGA